MTYKKRVRLSPEKRKALLLQSACVLAEKFGFYEVNHTKIAKHAKCSTGLVFAYLPTLPDLRSELADALKPADAKMFKLARQERSIYLQRIHNK